MVSVYSLMSLAIIRCIIVWYPTVFAIYGGPMITFSIVFTWVMGSVFAFPPLFGFGAFIPEASGLAYDFLLNLHTIDYN